MTMPGDLRWGEPVWVTVGFGIPDPIRSPREALTYLDGRWPAERGDSFADARTQCADALDSVASFQSARDAFVRAAHEARMLAS